MRNTIYIERTLPEVLECKINKDKNNYDTVMNGSSSKGSPTIKISNFSQQKYLFVYLVISILLSSSLNLLAQDTYLEVICYVESDNAAPIISATVELFENGTKVQTVSTDLKGKVSFNLKYNKSYKIVVSNKGMIQKRIDFKTDVSPEEQRSLKKEFAMSLVEGCQGADVSVFSEPVDIIEYDKGFGNFVSNKTYYEQMQARFARAYQSIDKCKSDKLTAKLNEASQQFVQGNYEEAIKLYEEALQLSPNDGTAKRQIAQARKNIEKQQANEGLYEQAIKDADAYLAQNNLSAAKLRYAEALRLNPSATYPQSKIAEIDKINAQQAAILQQQQAANAEYNSLIKQGSDAMAAKNYAMAQQVFEKAAALKPNEILATQKVAEAQQALQKQKSDQANQLRVENDYKEALSLAAIAVQQGDYITAKGHYQSAIALKPTESLPRQKLNEVEKLEQQRQENILAQQKADLNDKYNQAISNADALLEQKKYNEAKAAYQQAMSIKPSEKYAQAQLVKIQNLIVETEQAKQVALEKQYSESLATGDSKKINKEYVLAIAAYQQALQAKPNDPLASARLSEAQNLKIDKDRMDNEEQVNRTKYNELVQQGDGLFRSQDFNGSKTKYQQALVIYASEQYPKNQIAKIDNIISRSKQEAEYKEIIAVADNLFNKSSWDEAKIKYGLALQIFADNPYPKQQINEINKHISSDVKLAIEEKYNVLAAQAEQEVSQKNYEQAKSIYSLAIKVMPENPYPQKRINEINQLISLVSKSATEQKYNLLAAQAEQEITQKNYEQAKSLYSQAMQVMPENPYPQKRINEINQLISIDSKSATEQKYNSLTAQAEQEITQKNYEQAKSLYNQAMQVIPENPFPQRRINEINQMISDNTKQQVVSQYNKVITEADNFFAQKNYAEASKTYSRALTILPEQAYPQQKINEINTYQTDLSRQENSKAEIEKNYAQTIMLADKYFNDKNYLLAISEYNNALKIKPAEQGPKQQIDKINQILEAQQQSNIERLKFEKAYSDAVKKADALFKDRDYANAKNDYQEALKYKTGDIHASSQIRRIDQLLNEALNVGERAKQTRLQYNAQLENANTLYAENKLQESRKAYLSALAVIPGQDYPREQIRKIDEKIKIIAANQAAVKPVTTTASSTNVSEKKDKNLQEFDISSESKKKQYLDNLKAKYSEGVTKEVYPDISQTTTRYVVIRNGEVNEFREIVYKWGGVQYKYNGKPTNELYFNSQVKPRDGENFKEIN
jgi:tetratricopeptide (TPR) repeat protein